MSCRPTFAARRRAQLARRFAAPEALEGRSLVSDSLLSFSLGAGLLAVPAARSTVGADVAVAETPAARRRRRAPWERDADAPGVLPLSMAPGAATPFGAGPAVAAGRGDWLDLDDAPSGHGPGPLAVLGSRSSAGTVGGGSGAAAIAGTVTPARDAALPLRLPPAVAAEPATSPVATADPGPAGSAPRALSAPDGDDGTATTTSAGGDLTDSDAGAGTGTTQAAVPLVFQVSDPSAAETTQPPANTGTFHFYLPYNVGPLTVNFTVGGTAANGTDYQSIPTSVTIPSGQKDAYVTVTPIDDTRVEGPETVVLTISSSPNYSLLQSPSSGTVTIADNDPPDLDGADAAANAGYLSEAEEDNPGVLVQTSQAANPARIKAFKTDVAGNKRTLTWDATKVEVRDAGTLKASGLVLTEADGDKEYTVVAKAGFATADSVLVTMGVTNANNVQLGSDSVTLRHITFGVTSFVDTNGDGFVNDPGGNEFTFTAANPGVLTVPVKVAISPDTPGIRARLQGKVRVSLPAIGASQLTWDTQAAGVLEYRNGQWVANATFTGLPANNSDFGLKTATITVTGFWQKQKNYEVFFPRDATNHPGGQVGAPNWYHYWSQTSANFGTHTWEAGPGTGVTRFQNGAWRAFIRNAQGHTGGGTWNNAAGIDLFANLVRHEERHRLDNIDLWGANTGVDPAKDLDGDNFPDAKEPTYLAGRPYDPTTPTTYNDTFNYNSPHGGPLRDKEDLALRRQQAWTNGSANGQDWASPGMNHATHGNPDD